MLWIQNFCSTYVNHRKPTTYCLLISSNKSELFLSFFVSRLMANNQDIFIFEENLPICKFCLKKRVYPAERGDSHWHSHIFWCMGWVITMTLCNRNYELKKSQIVPEFHCIGSPIWKSEHRIQTFLFCYPLDSDAKDGRTLPLPPATPQCMITFNFYPLAHKFRISKLWAFSYDYIHSDGAQQFVHMLN